MFWPILGIRQHTLSVFSEYLDTPSAYSPTTLKKSNFAIPWLSVNQGQKILDPRSEGFERAKKPYHSSDE